MLNPAHSFVIAAMSRLSLSLLVCLAACGGDRAFHHDEDFSAARSHRREFVATPAAACEAARRVLIGRGYIVARDDEANEITLFGQKEFPQQEKRHAVLQMQVVCGPQGHGAVLHAAAVENHFDVAQSESKTAIGVPLLTPLSLSVARANRGQIKLAGESIGDDDFYAAFFKAIERELGRR